MFLSGFVQGQCQKTEQKHETKKLVEFHNQPTSINYAASDHGKNTFLTTKGHSFCSGGVANRDRPWGVDPLYTGVNWPSLVNNPHALFVLAVTYSLQPVYSSTQ